MTELQEKLINDQKTFQIKVEQLMKIFEVKNYQESKSITHLNELNHVQGLTYQLNTSTSQGISTDKSELQRRKTLYGDNAPVTKEPATIWELITCQLEDQILQILIAAAIVSMVIGISTEGWKTGWIEGTAISVAIIIILTVTAGNEYIKEKQFRKLNAQLNDRNVNVRRNGLTKNIQIEQLLVGDMLLIETGEIMPIDGILVDGKVSCDESNLTGESDEKEKKFDMNNRENDLFLLSGAKIQEGTGVCLVCAVGVNTQLGQMKLKLQEDDAKTPLQEKLQSLTDDISIVGMYCAILTFSLMSIHLLYNQYSQEKEIMTLEVLSEIMGFFILAITILVVAIPEGLPLAVVIALAYSVGKMKEENNLVRFLSACETMGGANNICSDKTGTLTQNKMTVTSLFAQDTVFTQFNQSLFNDTVLKQLCEGICINSNAFPKKKEGSQGFEQIGNKTDCALLQLAYDLGFDFNNYRPHQNIVKLFPFNPVKKRMSTVWKQNDKSYRVYAKGAMDFMLKDCTQYIGANGQIFDIDDVFTKNINNTMKKFANQCLRCILLTYRDIPVCNADQLTEEDVDGSLIVIGLAGIQDPLRPEVKEAVKQCKEAHVKVRMVTGDNTVTAIAIAKECGILSPNFDITQENGELTVMEGKAFREYVGDLVSENIESQDTEKIQRKRYVVGNIEKFKDVEKHLCVMSRATPDDKFLMATGLKQLEQVVAMTGDGANDAPALKKADVGFAMGIQGTEIAKEASGIILLDDNFKSIVTAIKWGRNIFDGIRKFIQFQLTVNVVAMFMVLLAGVILTKSPLNSIQMLWVNLIMDTMAALALATEPPTDELLTRKPYARREYMITPMMWRNIIMHSIYQMVLLLLVLFYGHEWFDVPYGVSEQKWDYENGKHFTIFFDIFVFLQIFNEINARKLKNTEINVFAGFFNNSLFVGVIIFTVIVQILIVQYGALAVHVAPLTMDQHLICLAIGASSLIVSIIIKKIPESFYLKFEIFRVQRIDEDPKVILQKEKAPSVIRRRAKSRVSTIIKANQPIVI